MSNDIFRSKYMNKESEMEKRTVSILGCGWLGLPLAKFLINNNYLVKGSTPTQSKLETLKKAGILPYNILLNPQINEDFQPDFFTSEILIVNFPPKRREDIEIFHPKQFKSLIEQINNSTIKNVIFISSTSVYANLNREVSEDDNQIPEKASGKALRKVEQMLCAEAKFKTTIIRFGGLIGYDRKPGRFLSKVKTAIDASAPVNLLHQDDCIKIISHIIENDLWGEVYNGCCPVHPTKKEFYEQAAIIGGFGLPNFTQSSSAFKIISANKLINTGFSFKYKNPIDALPF